MKNERIKICHIVNRISGKADGVFKHLIAQLTLLDKQIFEQFVITPYSKEIEQKFNELGINHYFVNELNTSNYIKAFLKVRSILKKEKYQILCCHLLKPLVIGGYLNFFNRIKLVYFNHGIFLDNDYNTWIEKFFYKILINLLSLKKELFALSPSRRSLEDVKRDFKKFKGYGFYYDGEAVVHPPDMLNVKLTFELIDKILEDPNSHNIIFAGRLNREKDPIYALKIFEELSKERDNVRMFIAGEGELEKKVKSYIKNHRLSNVCYFGYILGLNEYLGAFDILLVTSKREGMPVIIWEAMDKNLPFVSTDVGGIKEVLAFGNCGFIFKDKKDAVEKLKYLLDNQDKMNLMGKEGRKILRKYFHKQKFIDFFTNFYLNLYHEKNEYPSYLP